MFLNGIINEDLDFVVAYTIENGKIQFKDFDEDEKDVQMAIIDTGFQGNLIIPKNHFNSLQTEIADGNQQRLIDANKAENIYDVFTIPIKIKNKLFNTDVVFTDGEFLIGSSFLNEYFDSMCADFNTQEIDLEIEKDF